MHIGPTIGAALLFTLGLASPGLALNAETLIDLGDKIYGAIETAGEFDRLTFDAPRDAELEFSVKARDEGLNLSIALYPPDAPTVPEPIDEYLKTSSNKAKLKKFPVRVSGPWVLEIRASALTLGRYKLKTKIKYRKKWKWKEPVGAELEMPFPFAAAFGSRLKFKIKIEDGDIDPVVTRLETPSGPTLLPPDLEQSEIPLNETGEYVLVVQNAAAIDGRLQVKVKVKTPSADREKMYLSPRGFGPAPEVDVVDPKKGLQGAHLPNVLVEGEGFEPGATVCLRRKHKPDLMAQNVVVQSAFEITCSLDLEDLKTGAWDLVVENPSGGDDERSFRVQDPGSITLPPGVMSGTEVWFLEFSDEFESDLALFGLSSVSSSVTEKAADTVKAYVLYDLREIFGLRGSDGKVRNDAIPLSFVVEKPTTLVGAPGETYNRLRIGGEIQPGEPTSDNPTIPWGRSDVDPGNTGFDDLSRDGGGGRGLFLRALSPSGASVTPTWSTTFTALFVNPLTIADGKYFSAAFDPVTAQEGVRYQDIDTAIRTLAKEIASVASHHIGRAMGLANGAVGLSSTPAQVGTFADLVTPEFEEAELATLEQDRRASKLPGSARTLLATYLPLRGLAEFLLPDVQSATSVIIPLPHAGGRPNLRADELVYEGYYGFIPIGFAIGQAQIAGNSPFLVNGSTWNFGVHRFGLRIRDPVTADEDRPDHRINLLINLSLVPPNQKAQAQGINAQVRAAP